MHTYNRTVDLVFIVLPIVLLVVVGLVRNELRYRKGQRNTTMHLTPSEWDEWGDEL